MTSFPTVDESRDRLHRADGRLRRVTARTPEQFGIWRKECCPVTNYGSMGLATRAGNTFRVRWDLLSCEPERSSTTACT